MLLALNSMGAFVFLFVVLVVFVTLAARPALPAPFVARLGKAAVLVQAARILLLLGAGIAAVQFGLSAGTPDRLWVVTGPEATVLIQRTVTGIRGRNTWLAVDAKSGAHLASQDIELLRDWWRIKGVVDGHLVTTDLQGEIFVVDPRTLQSVLDGDALLARAAKSVGVERGAVRKLDIKVSKTGAVGLDAVTATGDTHRFDDLGLGGGDKGPPTGCARRGLWRLGSGIKSELIWYEQGAQGTGREFVEGALLVSCSDLAVVAAHREVDRPETAYLAQVGRDGVLQWEVEGVDMGIGRGTIKFVRHHEEDLIVIAAGLPTSAGPFDRFVGNEYILVARISVATGEVRWASTL